MILKNSKIWVVYLLVIIFSIIINSVFSNIILSITSSILLLIISLVGIIVYANAETMENLKNNKFLLFFSIIMLILSMLWIIVNILLWGIMYLVS